MDKLENTRSRVRCIRSMCRSFLPLILKETVILTAMSNYFLSYTQIIDQWQTETLLEVKGQGPTKVIMVCDAPPYGHAPTYQISLTYLERQKSYGPDKLCWEEVEEAEAEEKIRLKQYVSLRSKGRHNYR